MSDHTIISEVTCYMLHIGEMAHPSDLLGVTYPTETQLSYYGRILACSILPFLRSAAAGHGALGNTKPATQRCS